MKEKWNKLSRGKKAAVIIGIVLLVGVGLQPVPDKTTQTSNKVPTQAVVTPNAPEKPQEQPKAKEIETVPYKVVYKKDDIRYDKGKNFYVLIDPVEFKNKDELYATVQAIFTKMVMENGNKISIEIYDNSDVLELEYKRYVAMTLDRVLTAQETAEREQHLVATYDGELETAAYLNSISFYPAAFKDTPNIGQFVKTIEWKPKL